jgi:hypothetical protein
MPAGIAAMFASMLVLAVVTSRDSEVPWDTLLQKIGASHWVPSFASRPLL